MMGPTHALSGAAGWLLVAPLVSQIAPAPLTPAQVLVGAGVCAGAALLPDIDEPQSTIARSFGPMTWLLSKSVNAISAAWYNLTKTRREPVRVDGHRTLTHSLLGMLAITAAAAALCGWGGKPAALGLLFFMLGLAMRGLMGDWVRQQGWIVSTVSAAAAAFAAFAYLPPGNYWWLSAAVLTGLLLHGIGDGITKEGIPWLAPLPWRQKTWWEFTLPSVLRIRAGGFIEYALIAPALLLALTAGLIAQLVGWGPLINTLTNLFK